MHLNALRLLRVLACVYEGALYYEQLVSLAAFVENAATVCVLQLDAGVTHTHARTHTHTHTCVLSSQDAGARPA